MQFTLSDELAPRLQAHLTQISAQLAALVPRGEFHHIGATAIPGSITKGDVDVVLRVAQPGFVPATECLRRCFAINQPENWTGDFASFADEHSFPFPLGVQLVVKNSESDFFLFLVEYFISNPEQLAEYNRIKLQNAPLGIVEYRNAKERYLSPIIAGRPKRR
jgi:GrpB-like predicted nucleotidyltransferase (UPF0157 family)